MGKTYLFNYEKMFQIIILSSIFYFIYCLVDNKIMSRFINPRINYLIVLSLIMLFVIIMVQVSSLSESKRRNSAI
jgi:hypothetical protein